MNSIESTTDAYDLIDVICTKYADDPTVTAIINDAIILAIESVANRNGNSRLTFKDKYAVLVKPISDNATVMADIKEVTLLSLQAFKSEVHNQVVKSSAKKVSHE